MTTSYRGNRKRESARRRLLVRHEEHREALVRLARSFHAIAQGGSIDDDEPLVTLVYRAVEAQRSARITAGAALIAAGFGFGAVALVFPAALHLAFVAGWLFTFAVYFAAVRFWRARHGLRARSDLADDLYADAVRFQAHRLEAPSSLVPFIGITGAVVFPIGWIAYSVGLGASVALAAMIGVGLAAYVYLRALLDGERALLAVDVAPPPPPAAQLPQG